MEQRARSMELGAKSGEPGERSAEPGAKSLEHGAKRLKEQNTYAGADHFAPIKALDLRLEL